MSWEKHPALNLTHGKSLHQQPTILLLVTATAQPVCIQAVQNKEQTSLGCALNYKVIVIRKTAKPREEKYPPLYELYLIIVILFIHFAKII